MSYNIYKAFNIKNGKATMLDAESNLFNVSYDRNGRQHESLIFNRHTHDFCVNDITRKNSSGEDFDNIYYGMSDIQLYAKWMLTSAYCGDKYYEEKHKTAVELAGNWAKVVNDRAIDAYCKECGLSVDKFKAMSWKELHDMGWDDCRVYRNPTDEEMAEFTGLVEHHVAQFKLRKRTLKVVTRDGNTAYVTSSSTRAIKTISCEPRKPTYFCTRDIERVCKFVGNSYNIAPYKSLTVLNSKGEIEQEFTCEDYPF